ncbi:MAG: hypothetical protein HZB10_02775 [Candidatus Yonathbacteria bacterium]|nr:hypothetical protein [Candidatus Yonathbacteria bacterium]
MNIFYTQGARPGHNFVGLPAIRKRIIFDLVFLGAIFYTPWWVVVVLGFMGAFLWPQYYEIILFGLLMDLLYGAYALPFWGISGVLVSVLLYCGACYLKGIVR